MQSWVDVARVAAILTPIRKKSQGQNRRNRHAFSVSSRFLPPFLPTRKSTYILAARIFRKLKEKGVEVQTVEATIAAIAIENRLPLFTLNLRHFVPMRQISKLRLHPLPTS